jgi:hypothetical protein
MATYSRPGASTPHSRAVPFSSFLRNEMHEWHEAHATPDTGLTVLPTIAAVLRSAIQSLDFPVDARRIQWET